MKEKLKLCVAVLVFIFFLPYLLTVILQKGTTGDLPAPVQDARLEQLTGILAKEIPADSEPEAIKAQAIIARTNLYRWERGESGTEKPESFSAEELADYWGEAYPENMEKMQKAISETANQVLMQEGKLIDAAFHNVSSGRTRTAAEVPGQEEKGWLVSAESPADIRSADYITVIFFDREAMIQKLESVFSEKEMSGDEWISKLEIIGRDSAGYVTGVSCGDITLSGEEIRNALELPSACFYIAEVEEQVRVLVKGQGHGFGLSRYGANELAKEGKSCGEILHYYYSEVEIETYPQ